jgi:GTPase involved in cell partitioning and DNA repair
MLPPFKPIGTVVKEQIDGELVDLGSLMAAEDSLIVAQAGVGGEGTAVQGRNRGIKRPRAPPGGGERKTLLLTLKLVADVALVGVPNAGTCECAFLCSESPLIRSLAGDAVMLSVDTVMPSTY